MKKVSSTVRLDRYLTQCGYGTRNEATKLIKRGHVTVNGESIRKGNLKVQDTDEIKVDGILVVEEPPVYLWHKPVGVQSTIGDPMGRLSISECAPRDILPRYHPVGRLDADTSGLLLFSKLGALTQRLLHPKHEIPRRYRATSTDDFTPGQRTRLENGVETSLGTFSGQVMHSMVRRMLANVERPVETLKRLEYGPFKLASLPEDELRAPDPIEWQRAIEMALPGF